MIQGADHVDISSCGAIKPMSGFDPTKQLVLVRNPDYRASSDSRGDRSNFLNGISVIVDSNVSDIIDKAALQRAWGGPTQGQIATHIMPPSVLDDQLTNSFDPYATPGEAGSLAKAQAEMKLSKYDSNHDGMCDASVCKNLVMINRNYAPWTNMEPIVVDDLAKIGIRVLPRELETSAAYQTIQTVNNDIPIALNAG